VSPTVAEMLEAAAERMRAPELLSEDPRQEARELVAHALGIVPAQLADCAHERLDARAHGDFLRLLQRRLSLEPTGYIVGAVEILGSLGLVFGVLTRLAAAGLILVMLGAIQKKIFVWHTGFWGKGSQGWHYDLIFIVMNLVIIVTDGGRFVLMK